MFDYETILKTAVLTIYFTLILFDICWIVYGIVTFVKWIMKRIRKKKEAPSEAETK